MSVAYDVTVIYTDLKHRFMIAWYIYVTRENLFLQIIPWSVPIAYSWLTVYRLTLLMIKYI